ncbi:AraC family transcriptional regulator [Gordonia terrae]|uniref:AraC family transcriptional regulator n=3 Tax=Gordonia terrae TaxID=2055 RepID=A0AAD0KBZ5_9ACTN|nr:AraC family transcriptional regulator [Gordonia terrae]GAB45035.1 hypothetical protein GOTRE_078_00020 [Gordonia terrae NBRC 100016]VTR07186.1 DNA-binding transcriptional activator FeaR [Clostridioides difficile]VTS41158.1 DNA-binding transcriptional activator FeaR [Gordonia terrae]
MGEGARMNGRGYSRRGLEPAVVDAWYDRWGVRHPDELPDPIRLRGRAGLAAYSSAFSSVNAEFPEGYESIIYHRKMSMMMAHCELHTPRTTELTRAAIREMPIDLVIVAAHVLESDLRITQYGTEMAYGEGQLVVLALDSPFVNVVDCVADSAMLLIPKRLLGLSSESGSAPRLPVAADSLVSRSTAQFVRRFASDAAMLGREVTTEMELAAIRMIREAIGMHSYHERHPQRDSVMVREAAAELIEQHFADPRYSADSIASALHMSRRHLYRHFADADTSPAILLKRRRLAHAMELLAAEPDLPLDAVAGRSGFLSVAALRGRLRAEFGAGWTEIRTPVHPPRPPASPKSSGHHRAQGPTGG